MNAPTGTVTFVFTDVVNSTVLWETAPEAMAHALGRHDAILREAFESRGGYIFSLAGDAFAVAFQRANDALHAVIAAQRGLQSEPWPEEAPVAARMGIHTGEAKERDGNYFGSAVNRAARIMSVAAGGQVLISLASEQLLRDAIPPGTRLRDLDDISLKGLSGTQRVFDLAIAGLKTEFPPLQTTVPGNLPVPATSFVGRADDLQRLAQELKPRNLVTLVGVGGVGKTRLAIEAGWHQAASFPEGAWLCELAPVADIEGVAPVLLSTVGLRQQEGMSVLESLVDGLKRRRMLLILDNCEHVLDSAAEAAAQLTAGCPWLTVIATSREPLGVDGEHVWPIRSLDPALEGIDLFLDRARAADATFDATQQIETIQSLCRRLDGIPLAIELAAARVRTMTVSDIATHLDDRFRLLRGSGRGRVERHQTMRAAVQWSYELLTHAERVLFDRLSVFPATFDLDAAEAICAGGFVDGPDVLDLLTALVDRSMVAAERGGEHMRYRLLETFRQFGSEHLVADDVRRMRDAHADHYLIAAEQAHRQLNRLEWSKGRTFFLAEWDNIRAVAEWALVNTGIERTDRLLAALAYWCTDQPTPEIADWANRSITLGSTMPSTWNVAATIAGQRGELGDQLRLAQTALSLATAGTGEDVAWAHLMIAGARGAGGDPGYREGVRAAYAALQESPWSGIRVICAANYAQELDSLAEATELLRVAQDWAERVGNCSASYHVTMRLGAWQQLHGDAEAAFTTYRRGVAIADQCGLPWPQVQSRRQLAAAASVLRRAESRDLLTDALEYADHQRLGREIAVGLELAALHWSESGQNEPAAVVIGFLERHALRWAPYAARRASATAALSILAETPAWKALGGALTRDQLLDYVLERLHAEQDPERVSGATGA